MEGKLSRTAGLFLEFMSSRKIRICKEKVALFGWGKEIKRLELALSTVQSQFSHHRGNGKWPQAPGRLFSLAAVSTGRPEGRTLAGYYCFNANISFTFQAVKNPSAHPTYLCSGLFCKLFGVFFVFVFVLFFFWGGGGGGVYLDTESFSQRISKSFKIRI